MVSNKTIALTAFIKAGMVALVVLLALLVVNAAEVLLALFGGILLAIVFHSAADWLHRKSGIARRYALALTILILLAGAALGIWGMAPAVSAQASELAERLPDAIDQFRGQLRAQLMAYDGAARLVPDADRLRDMLPGDEQRARYVSDFFSSTLGALGNAAFILFVGLFLAIDPGMYVRGLLQLVPARRQARTRQVLAETAKALQGWLIAKLIAMAVIGVLTSAGLYALGVDLALILGVIAALLSFVPNVGPIIAVIPAALVALVTGPALALYVLLLYAAIQALESYGLTPFLQQRMLSMPPALLLTMQVLLGVLAGILGVIFATPLTAAAMVMIRMWYVEDLLGHDGHREAAAPPGD